MWSATRRSHRLPVLTAIVASFLLVAASSAAQPESAASNTANQASNDPGGRLPAEYRQLYVPIEDLETVLERDPQGVLLSKDEFRKLLEAAKENSKRRPDIVDPVVVTRAEYEASITEEHLLVRAAIHFTQIANGWQVLRVPFQGVSVEKATVGGKPARLALAVRRSPDANTQTPELYLLNDQPGAVVLEMELSVRLEASGSDRSAVFQVPPTPATQWRVSVPAGRHLLVGGLTLNRPAPDSQPAVHAFELSSTGKVALLFTERKREERAETMLFARSSYSADVAPGEIRWRAETDLQVFGKPVSEVAAEIPDTLEVLSVEANGLESWRLAGANATAKTRELIVKFREPSGDARRLTLRGVLSDHGDGGWRVPNVRLKAAASHVGHVVIRYPEGVRLRQVRSEAVRQVLPTATETTSRSATSSPSDKGASAPMLGHGLPTVPGVQRGQETRAERTASAAPVGQAQHALAFDAWRDDFFLSFVTLTKSREIQVSLSTILDIAAGLDLLTMASFETAFAPLYELDVVLPADWLIAEVKLGEQAVVWRVLPHEAGFHRIRVPLQPPLPPGQEAQLKVTAHRDPENWPVGDNPVNVPIPEVRLPQASVVEGSYVIKAEPSLEVVPENVTGLDSAQVSVEGGRLGFTYQDTRFSGTLRISRAPSRVSARGLSIVRLDTDHVSAHLEAELEIRGGGIQKLVVALPERVGENLRFTTFGNEATIVEQRVDAPRDGRRNWTLQFDRRATGPMTLGVDVIVPRGSEKEFAPPALLFPTADWQNGYIALEGAGDQQLTIAAVDRAGQPLPPVDPIDLPAARYVPKERIVAAYRYVADDFQVTVAEERFERLAVPRAIGDRFEISSVLGNTDEFQHHANCVFAAAGVQSLRVQLPDSATLWATLIDRQPVVVQKVAAADFLIPLPPGMAPASRHTLELFYRTTSEPQRRKARIEQKPPVLQAVSGDGQTLDLEVLEHRWTVHYPESTSLVESDGPFAPLTRLDPVSLLKGLGGSAGLPSYRQLVVNGVCIAFVALMLAVLVAGYRRWGCLGSVGCGVLSLFLAGFALVLNLPPGCSSLESPMASRRLGVDLAQEVATTVPAIQFDDDLARGAAPRKEAIQEMDEDAQSQVLQRRDRRLGTVVTEVEDLAVEGADKPVAGRVLQRRAPIQAGQPPAPDAALTPAQSASGVAMNRPAAQAGEPSQQQGGLGGAFGFGGVAGGGQGVPVPDAQPQQQAPAAQPAPAPQQDLDIAFRAPGRGLLSLALEFGVPEGMLSKEFRYVGTRTADLALRIACADLTAGLVRRSALFALITLLFWWCRNRSGKSRAVLGVLGIGVPIALAGILPELWCVYLDGLLLGSVAGLMLWCLRSVVEWAGSLRGRWRLRRQRAKAVAASAVVGLLAISFFSCVPAVGADPPPAQQAARPPASGGAIGVQPPGVPLQQPPAIIVPYDPAKGPLAAEHVLIPHTEFLKLRNLADPASQQTPPAPTEGTVSEVYYVAELKTGEAADQTIAEVRGRLVLHSFRKHQIALAIPIGDVVLAEARLDGAVASLRLKRGGQAHSAPKTPQNEPVPDGFAYEILVEQPGAHVLDVRFEVPVRQTGLAGEFTVPLRRAPTGKLFFTLPADDLQVRVNGSSQLFRRSKNAEGRAQIELPTSDVEAVTISWRPPQERDKADKILHVDSSLAVHVEDAGVFLRTGHLIRVRQGTVEELEFRLPERLRVQRVAGPDLAGWALNAAPNQRTLRVSFGRSITDETRLAFELYVEGSAVDLEQSFTLPDFGPQNVTRETGTLGVFADGQFAVRAENVSGLSQTNVAEFHAIAAAGAATPEPPQQPAPKERVMPLSAYRFSARPIALQLQVKRRVTELTATAQHAIVVDRRKVRISSHFGMELSGEARSSIAIEVPAEFLIVDVSATGLSDWSVDAGTRPVTRTLRIELDAPRTGALEVTMQGHQPKQPDTASLDMLLPRAVDATKGRTSAAVWVDDSYTATADRFPGWKAVDPGESPETLRARMSRPAQFAFTSDQLAFEPIALRIQQAVPRLTASSVTVVTVGDSFVNHTVAMKWRITQAAAREFTFLTPNWLAGKLELQGSGIRQVSETDAPNGQTQWTITLHEPVRNEYFVLAQGTLPPPPSDDIAAPTIRLAGGGAEMGQAPAERGQAPNVLFGASPLSAAQAQEHFVLLINASQTHLELLDKTAVESVPAEDIPIQLTKSHLDQAVEIWRIPRGGQAPVWKRHKLPRQRGIPASVNLADLVTVIAADGTWRTQATYTCKNRSRQFLALEVPAQATVLSVFVDGQPARPVRTVHNQRPLQLIALPKSSEADLSFQIRVVLTGELPPKGLADEVRVRASELDLPAPQVLSQTDDAEFGIPVAKTVWTVYVPEHTDAEIVDDVRRTNMILAATDARELAYKVAKMKEAVELFDVLEGDYSGRTKLQAWSNIQSLGKSIDLDGTVRLAEQGGADGRAYQELAEKFQSQLAANERRVLVEADSQSLKVMTDGTVNWRDLDEAQQKDQLRITNSALYAGNDLVQGDFKAAARQEQERLGFELKGPAAGPPARPEEAAKRLVTGKGKGVVADRELRRQKSVEQLSELNVELGVKKGTLERFRKQRGREVQAGERWDVAQNAQRDAAAARSRQQVLAGVEVAQAPSPPPQPPAGGVAGASEAAPVDAGGLSLETDVPTSGTRLTLSKVGGSPKVALSIRPHRSYHMALSLVWCLAWGVVAIAVILVVLRLGANVALRGLVVPGLIAVGLFAAFFIQPPASLCGLALFAIGAIAAGIQKARAPKLR